MVVVGAGEGASGGRGVGGCGVKGAVGWNPSEFAAFLVIANTGRE